MLRRPRTTRPVQVSRNRSFAESAARDVYAQMDDTFEPRFEKEREMVR